MGAKKTSEKPRTSAKNESKKESWEVFDAKGNYVRTYSVKVHGKEAEKLARMFAGKIHGRVK